MNHKADLGKLGEDIVAKKLERDGFKILDRNYKRLYGEIDLIVTKKDLVVFVEVKMRQNRNFDLEYLINYSKQKKILLVAKEYICRHNICDKICRFDVALIKGNKYNYELNYIENAFCEE